MGRPLLALLLLSLALACGAREAHAPRPNAPGPDIVLVSIDSLRFDHLGCYGYKPPTSPAIDRLATEGVRCETAISTTSWTLPSHAAMFTGLFDSAHGVVDNGLALPDERVTLAEVLRDAGWQTAGFYGGPYLEPAFGLSQGFETWRSCMSEAVRESASHRDVTGPRTLAEVTKWLDEGMEKPGGRPLFLFLHLWDVHYDYVPPPEYAKLFDPDYPGSLDASDLMNNPAVGPRMAPRDFQHLVALYDGEIRFTDDVLGKILGEIGRRGRLENALVVVTADHGEEFFEHDGKGHQRTLFDEVVRVPLIFRWKGQLPTRSVVKEPVRLVDLLPTLLSLAGVAEVPAAQGRDIAPLLLGEKLPPAPALCELLVDGNDLHALRTERAKVLDYRHANTRIGYDLLMDPREERPLAEDSDLVRAGLDDLSREIEASLASRRGREARPFGLDPDLKRRLGDLGYVGRETAGARKEKDR